MATRSCASTRRPAASRCLGQDDREDDARSRAWCRTPRSLATHRSPQEGGSHHEHRRPPLLHEEKECRIYEHVLGRVMESCDNLLARLNQKAEGSKRSAGSTSTTSFAPWSPATTSVPRTCRDCCRIMLPAHAGDVHVSLEKTTLSLEESDQHHRPWNLRWKRHADSG